MFIFIPYFSSTARSPGSYLVVFGLASLISLIVVSILYSEAYSDLNALQTYQCHIQRQFITQRLCTVQDCTKAQQFNIRNFEPPRMYGGSDPTSTNLEMFKQRNEEQVTLLQQQPSPTTCQSYTSLCYEAEWYVNYNGYYGGYSTIASGMVSTSPEQAAQVLELVSNRSVIPYNCYARASYSTFHWHQWQFPVLIPQDWLIGVIVTSVLTSLFVLMFVVYLGVCIYRRRRSSSRRASSINDSEKQPLNIENGRKTPSSSASSGATKKKATTTTTRNATSHATSTTLPRTQQQQIPATTNVMVSQPQQNTQYYNNTATTQIGNNNMDNGAIVYYNNNGGAVNNAQSSGANYQQQPQPQSMYQK